MAIHSSILAWKVSWTEEPGGLQSMGLQRAEHDYMHALHQDWCGWYTGPVESMGHSMT